MQSQFAFELDVPVPPSIDGRRERGAARRADAKAILQCFSTVMEKTMNPHETAQTITPDHLVRKAVVYLRQSSLQQIKHNLESQHLQYALADRAKALGFHHVEIIDCDLGVSAGPGAQAREGFKQLLASVALGDVGIVLSRESRGSRAPTRTGVT